MDYEKAYKAVLQTVTQWIKDGCTDKEKICLECVFPELRESEDERIRKFLITIVNNLCAPNFKDVERKDVLAYLEKQKDILSERANNITINMLEDGIEGIQRELIEFLSNTINAPWVDVIKSADAYAQRIRSMVEKQKEHQNNSDAPNESSWSGIISSSDKDKNLDEIAQDYVEAVKDYNPEPTWDLMQTAVCYGYHYREQKEQKPADDKAFEEWVDDWWKHHKVNNPDSYDKGDEIQFDERGFKNFCRGIRNMYAEQKRRDRFEGARKKYQVEWSGEDENTLENLHELITFGFTEKFFDAQTTVDIRKWLNTRLKSIRPSWKPSEEQIYSLGTVVKGYDECTVGSVGYHLKEMYEQLKKLI